MDQEKLRAGDLEILSEAVRLIPNTEETFPDRDDYIKLGYAIKGATQDDPERGFDIFLEWALRWPGRNGHVNTPESVRLDWDRMRAPFQIGADYVLDTARSHGFDLARYEFPDDLPPAVEPDRAEGFVESEVQYSDSWMADRFVQEQGAKVRYIPKWGKWIAWDGSIWREDIPTAVPALARRVCTDIANRVSRMGATAKEIARNQTLAKTLASRRQVDNTVALAQQDPRVQLSHEALNTHKDLLGVPGGVIDLMSGELLPPDPSLFLTRSAAVSPQKVDCPVWMRFLSETAQGDREYIAFLQRLAGYILTGRIDEHALFFCWGPGGNGKSTFVNTLESVMGQYSRTASMEVFISSAYSRHPTELASLAGSRMVVAQEMKEGQSWDESRIKALTGGDRITARFVHENEFMFEPEFKLVLVGNARPELARVDDAVRRRFNLLPFTFKPARANPRLMDELRAEAPAILWWAIKGAVEWYRGGLRSPKVVLDASEEYMERNDAPGRWLKDRCLIGEGNHAEVQHLFNDWARWGELTGERVGSMKKFSQMLEDRGFKRTRAAGSGRSAFAGLGLKDGPGSEFQEVTR